MKTMVTGSTSPVRPTQLAIVKPPGLQRLSKDGEVELAKRQIVAGKEPGAASLPKFPGEGLKDCESPSSVSPTPTVTSPQISLLEPPPPDVLSVSRRESSDSWHNFLVELNRILQDRVGEYV